MIADVSRRDVVDDNVRRPSVFDRVHEATRRDLSATWRRGRRDPRQTQTDGAARRRASRRRASRPLAATSRTREPAAHIPEQSRAERSGAARRDACCASSRAEDETTRKKLRRMHATVVRASLNSRVLVSGAYSGAKMLEFHERTLNSSSPTGFSRATRLRLMFLT